MAESIVTLRVEAKNAISSLNKTSRATKTLSQSAKGATGSLAAASTAAKGLGASLAASLGPLLTVSAAVATVSNAIRTFSDRERDVTILRQGLENLGAGTLALNELQEAANRLGNQTLFNQEEFTRGFNLLTSFRKIGVDAYERVAQAAADIAQVNQVDVNTSFMQLAKALQDPERNLSNLNRSGIAFTKTQQDVIKELMKTNKTADAHAMILGIVEESYNKLSQAAAGGFAGNVDSLGEAFRDFSETLGKALEPALIGVTKGLTALIKATNDFINSPIGKASFIIGGIALAAKGLPVLLTGVSVALMKVAAAGGVITIALNAIPFVALATGATLLTAQIIKTNEAKKKFNDLFNKGDEQEVTQALKDQAKVIGELQNKLNSAKGRDKKIIQDKLKEAELDAKKLEGRLQTIQSDKKIEEAANKIVALKKEGNKEDEKATKLTDEQKKNIKDFASGIVEVIKLENDKNEAFKKFIKRQEQSGELLQATINGNEREVQLQHDINNAVAIHGEHNRQKITDTLTANSLLKDQTNAIEKNVEGAGKLADKFDEIGLAIETSIKDNLRDAITGAQSFGQAMTNVLNRIRDRIIDNQLDNLLGNFGSNFSSSAKGGERKGLGGFIGGVLGGLFKANGGPVKAGQPYIVGERQPELFVPRTSGTILPSVPTGGGGTTNMITVNVDASGSSVQGNGSEADQLGGLIASVVQATIIDEQRAGGLLNR